MERKICFIATENITDELCTAVNAYLKQMLLHNVGQDEKERRLPTITDVKAGLICALCLQQQAEQVEVNESPFHWEAIKMGSCSSFIDYLTQHTNTCATRACDQSQTALLADHLHELAASLNKIGTYVDIVWLATAQHFPNLMDHLDLFGALKRLTEWHNARIYIVNVDSRNTIAELENSCRDWIDSLHVQITIPGYLKESSTAWRGSIHLTGGSGSKGMVLPGFSLSSFQPLLPTVSARLSFSNEIVTENEIDEVLMGHHMDFIAPVSRTHFPEYLVSPTAYKLNVTSCSLNLTKSHEFLKKLQKDPNLCYILRLEYGTSWKETTTKKNVSKKGRKPPKCGSAEDWRKKVLENISNITDYICTAELDGYCDHFRFLVHGGICEEDNYCVANLLYPPSVFNGAIGHQLALEELSNPRNGKFPTHDEACDEHKLIQTLPHMSGEGLLQLQHDMEMAQALAVQTWIEEKQRSGESTMMSVTELTALLGAVRGHFSDLKSYSIPRPASNTQVLLQPKAESTLETSTQYERLALKLWETHHTKMTKLKSGDSLAGLSPPPKGEVLQLDAAEFLKAFTSEGLPVKKAMQASGEENASSLRFSKYDSGEGVTAPWPNCSSYKYHDMYFNIGEQSELLEIQCNKLRAKMQGIETASTCTGQQANNPATMNIGRKKKSADQGMHNAHENREDVKENVTRERHSSGKRRAGTKLTSSAEKRVALLQKQKKDIALKSANRKPETSAPCKVVGKQMTREERLIRARRHKQKLEDIVRRTLNKSGVMETDGIFDACAKRLFSLTKVFVKDLPTSHNLREEMERIAQSQVQQVIDFECKRT